MTLGDDNSVLTQALTGVLEKSDPHKSVVMTVKCPCTGRDLEMSLSVGHGCAEGLVHHVTTALRLFSSSNGEHQKRAGVEVTVSLV